MHVLLLTKDPNYQELFKDSMPTCGVDTSLTTFDSIGDMWFSLSTRQKSFPNLIFVDFELSRAYDDEVVPFLKNNDYLRTAPVIMIANSADPAEIYLAYQSYAACVVLVPRDGAISRRTIQSCLEFWCTCAELPNRRRNGF
jgi:hypothetical protein